MMKRFLCLMTALTLSLGLAACGSRTARDVREAVESVLPTVDPARETMTPAAETPEISDMPREDGLSVRDVMESIREAKPEELDTPVTTYAAAARVLTFCQEGGAKQSDFEQEVRDWVKGLSGEEREAFIASARAVSELAQRIAQGDVEQSELEEALADSDANWRDFDPVNFQHENLERFVEVVTKALEGK